MFSECALGPLLLLMELCKTLFGIYARALELNPLRVKIATSVTLSFIGDVCAQQLEHFYRGRKRSHADKLKTEELEPAKEPKPWKWNVRRTMSVSAFAILWSTIAHLWYDNLDAWALLYYPANLVSQTIFKVVVDMIIWEPISVALFFSSVGFLEGRSYDQIRTKFSDSFLPTVAVDFFVWPGFTAYIFLNIPVNWQVIAFCLMDLFYDAFLSIVQHNDVFREISNFIKRCLFAPCKRGGSSSDSSSSKDIPPDKSTSQTSQRESVPSPPPVTNDSSSVALDILET